MKTLRVLATAAVLLALVACGSKSKKEDTTMTDEQVSADTGADQETEPVEQETDTDTTAKERAELQDVIYFEFDSSDLGSQAREALNENAEWLKEDPDRTLRIEGHTDEVGTPEYNIGLGERRARAAKEYLSRLGIDESRVEIISYGEEKPAGEADEENRRSVFIATRQ